jgi:hypothetical protein
MIATAEPRPECPRCGYDQSGAIATWEGASPPACPLEGRCSECGLLFSWGDVLNPRLSGPPWSFEHHGHTWLVRLARSVRMCLRPRRLWSELRLEHPVHLGRAAIVSMMGILLAYLVATGLHFGLWSLAAWQYPAKIVWTRGSQSISPFYNFVSRYGGHGSLWPFGHPWSDGPAGVFDPWVAHALLMIVVMPLGFLALPDTLRRAKVRKRHLARVWLYSLPAAPLLYIWVIARVLRDSMPWSYWSSPQWNRGWGHLVNELPRWVLLPASLAFLWIWWAAATRSYMRIEEARRVVVAMLVIAFLAAAVGVLVVPSWNREALVTYGY